MKRVPEAAILWAVRNQMPHPCPARLWSFVPRYDAACAALKRVADLLSWVREGAPGPAPWDLWTCLRMFGVEVALRGGGRTEVTQWGLLSAEWLDRWLTAVYGQDYTAWPGAPGWQRPATGWEQVQPYKGRFAWDKPRRRMRRNR